MKNQFLKKTMALALAGVMTLSMAACGKDDAGNDSQADTQQSEQQAGKTGEYILQGKPSGATTFRGSQYSHDSCLLCRGHYV